MSSEAILPGRVAVKGKTRMLDNTHQSAAQVERMAKMKAAAETGAELAVGGILHRASQFSEMFDRKWLVV